MVHEQKEIPASNELNRADDDIDSSDSVEVKGNRPYNTILKLKSSKESI